MLVTAVPLFAPCENTLNVDAPLAPCVKLFRYKKLDISL